MITIPRSAEGFPPGEYLRDELAERGWTEAEFAHIIDRPVQMVSEILNGKKDITPATAVAFGDALGTSAELWLNLQAAYRLHLTRGDNPKGELVIRRARLRSLVPVRELQRRGWLPASDELDEIEAAVCELLGIANVSEEPRLLAVARKSDVAHPFSPEQIAWIARVKRLGQAKYPSTSFDRARLEGVAADLVRMIHDPLDLQAVVEAVENCGVVVVIEEALKGSKIDGVALIAEDGVPIIGLSTRGDRMDSFVFTLLHEIAHLVLDHLQTGEIHLDENLDIAAGSEDEVAANDLAASWVFPNGLDAGTSKPSMAAVLALAKANRVHASFVIGRLQRMGVLGWGDFRRAIPKVRPFLGLGV